MSGRQPDYHLHAMNKDTDRKGRIGAAWKNDDGSISIKLDAFVVLNSNDNLEVRLFTNRYAAPAASPPVPPPTPQEEPKQPYTTKDLHDDIPF